jgi:hypothetical protein
MLQPFLASFAQLATIKQAINGGHPPIVMPNMGLIWLGELVIFFAYAWIGVGIAKEILGLRSGPRFVYLPGKDELHAILSLFIVFVFAYAALLAIFIAVAIVGGIGFVVALATGGIHTDVSPQTAKTFLPFLPWLLLFVAVVEIVFIYFFIRMAHLIVPYVVVQKRIVLFDSWKTMRGNVLRAVAIGIVCALPLIAIEAVFAIVVIVPTIVRAAAMADPSQAPAMFAAMSQQWAHYFPLYAAVLLVLTPIVAGLTGAPAVFAYRAIVPPPEPARE